MNKKARLLELNREDKILREFEILEPDIILGRTTSAGIMLNSEDVSRVHAQILNTQEGFFIIDLGSTNGTLINGRKLKPKQSVKLNSNDTLEIGDVKFMFQVVANSIPSINQVNKISGDNENRQKVYNIQSNLFDVISDFEEEKKHFKDKLLKSLETKLSDYAFKSWEKQKRKKIFALPSKTEEIEYINDVDEEVEVINNNIRDDYKFSFKPYSPYKHEEYQEIEEDIEFIEEETPSNFNNTYRVEQIINFNNKEKIETPLLEDWEAFKEEAHQEAYVDSPKTDYYFRNMAFAEKLTQEDKFKGFSTIKFPELPKNNILYSSLGLLSLTALFYIYIKFSPVFG